MEKIKKMVVCSIAALLCFSLVVSPINNAGGEQEKISPPGKQKGFSDIGPGHWAYKPISSIANRGIINGYPDGTFQPLRMVSRSEFTSMLAAAAGLSPNRARAGIYADVPGGSWFEAAVNAAGNLLPGSVHKDGKAYFLPHDKATREDVTVALVNALGVDYRNVDPNIIRTSFKDYEQVSLTARQPLAWAYKNKLLRGSPDGMLRPRDGISRAEVAALLYRAFLLDTSIRGLIAYGEIEPLSESDPEFGNLVGILKNKYGEIEMSIVQTYDIDYHAQKLKLYNGEGPEIIYVFACIEPKYHNWEADFARNGAKAGLFVENVAREAARMYPQDIVLVMLGHSIPFLFDVSEIYQEKYLTRTSDGWRLERFYAGAMAADGSITGTWNAREDEN